MIDFVIIGGGMIICVVFVILFGVWWQTKKENTEDVKSDERKRQIEEAKSKSVFAEGDIVVHILTREQLIVLCPVIEPLDGEDGYAIDCYCCRHKDYSKAYYNEFELKPRCLA